MNDYIDVEDIRIEIEYKKIKNMYLKVLPPDGEVKVIAPKRMTEEEIYRFVSTKVDWIRAAQAKYENMPKPLVYKYETGELHYLWGQSYELWVVTGSPNRVWLREDKLMMQVKSHSTVEERETLLEKWYKEQLKLAMKSMCEQCVKIVGKSPDEWRVRNMKTKWGTCNVTDSRIWLNVQLAKKPKECLEYVILHELTHLYVPNHGPEFKEYMDRFCPDWRAVKKRLNEPLG